MRLGPDEVHDPSDAVTSRIDRIDDLGENTEIDPFVREAGVRVIEKCEW